MKSIKLFLLAGITLSTCITTVKAQTADEIMEKHQKAMGGAAWENVKTLKMVGSASGQGMEITMTQTIAMGKAARLDMSLMGMSGYFIVTQKEGWMFMPFGQTNPKVDTMKPEMVKTYQKQFDIKGHQYLDYKTNGTKVEYVGKDTINSIACYKLKITDKDGTETVSCFDAATYYLLRSESKVKTEDGEQEMATVYNNYQKISEGIVMPMSVTTQGAEITYKSIEINKPIDESIFIPTVGK
jgi:outer membrane lipoprotein-sorting protein